MEEYLNWPNIIRWIYTEILSGPLADFLEDEVSLRDLSRMWYQHDGAPTHKSAQPCTFLAQTFDTQIIGYGGQEVAEATGGVSDADCCDGSDEYNSTADCINTCMSGIAGCKMKGWTNRANLHHSTTACVDRWIARMTVMDRAATPRTIAQQIQSAMHHSVPACSI
ncbi:uncharacterized protein TNCV_619741 [Trichonephila clavipes]|nr:uncharacterized protein TNCV_619741 [Trichonephila clavipes]